MRCQPKYEKFFCDLKLFLFIVLGEGNATWMPENAPYRISDIDFGQVEISAYKLAARLLVSDELLEDSAVDLESLITELFKAEMNDAEEAAFFTGDGKSPMITADALAREIRDEVLAESPQMRALRLMCFTTSMLQEMLKHRNKYYTHCLFVFYATLFHRSQHIWQCFTLKEDSF